MNEFEKNQDKNQQEGQQGDKPAFGQLDKEQGQQDQQQPNQKGEPIDEGQQEQGQAKPDELAGADPRDDIQPMGQGDQGGEDERNR